MPLVLAAAAVAAVSVVSAVDSSLDRLEDLLADICSNLRDDDASPVPFLAADGQTINLAWKSAVYAAVDERAPEMGSYFVDWYIREEARARAEKRQPRLPWHRKLRYPVLAAGRNGSVEPASLDVHFAADGSFTLRPY